MDNVNQGRAVLYLFAISHYCEKARWALDRVGIEYELQHLPPGPHRRVAKRLGARTGSLPILQYGQDLVQGSSAIIDWAEKNRASGTPTLEPEANAEEARKIEKRLDDILGVHVRRYFYSEALLEYPQTVKPMFAIGLSSGQKLLLELSWGFIRKLMIRGMNLGSMQGIESREILEKEFDWLDGLLADGRQYLQGPHFSRVDICAASLLSPLIKPPEHPSYDRIRLPPNMTLDCEGWRKRPCLQWALDMYHNHR